jgi:hypothetical protein
MKIIIKGIPLNNFPKPETIANNPQELMQAMRFVRGFMLVESDWTQVPDSPLDEVTREQWRQWRQELRDLTKQITIFNIGDYFEVSDPPSIGMPSHWSIWEQGVSQHMEAYIESANIDDHETSEHLHDAIDS